jgi:hypothetical protein
VSGRWPVISGDSSPRVSLARTSLRTRYCCPRPSGSTLSRMSPSRRPPTHSSGGDRHGHQRCQSSRTGRASEVHYCWCTLPPRNRETPRRGSDLRDHVQRPLGAGRLPGSIRCDACRNGIDRMAYSWSCAAQRVAFHSSCALRSDTPTRATARTRKEPTRSTPKLAHVRQPRTTVVNPA